ncbi:MAG: DHHA1 domain-containing protein, partial [Planctomycetota bacterium]
SELNETRQSLERSVLLAARKQAKASFDPANDPALVLADRGWHPGVIGIVAGKLVEQHGVPVVVVSQDKLGVAPAIGSGRSVPGFDLAAALADCSEHLESCGGHAAAAGLRVRDENLDAFRIDFCTRVATARAGDDSELELAIDAETPLAALTHQTVRQIEQLAPFGHGNRRPTLCTHGVRLAAPPRRIGGAGRHLSLEVEQHGVKLRAVAFGGGDWEDRLARVDGPLAIAFKPVLNTFRGLSRVEMHLEDWREDPTA